MPNLETTCKISDSVGFNRDNGLRICLKKQTNKQMPSVIPRKVVHGKPFLEKQFQKS